LHIGKIRKCRPCFGRARLGNVQGSGASPISPAMTQQNLALATEPAVDNPLFNEWTGAFGVAPFERIKPEHFSPAFERAFAEHAAEVAAIAADPAEPTFANTIEALELSGDLLTRVDPIFGLGSGAHT